MTDEINENIRKQKKSKNETKKKTKFIFEKKNFQSD